MTYLYKITSGRFLGWTFPVEADDDAEAEREAEICYVGLFVDEPMSVGLGEYELVEVTP